LAHAQEGGRCYGEQVVGSRALILLVILALHLTAFSIGLWVRKLQRRRRLRKKR
jgi:hypothetical protein